MNEDEESHELSFVYKLVLVPTEGIFPAGLLDSGNGIINFMGAESLSLSSGNVVVEGPDRKAYENVPEKLGIIITEISKLPIPTKTIENWKTLMYSICVVDHRIDTNTDKDRRKILTQSLISFLKGESFDFSSDKELEKAMQDVRDLSLGLSEGQRNFFINSLVIVLKVTEEIKSEENIKKLIKLTKLEGQSSTRIFLFFLPEIFKQSGNYQKLTHAITRLGRIANTLDNAIDLPNDYRNEEVRVKPNILNRALFLGAALSDTVSMLKDTGISKDLIKKLV